MAQGPVPRRLRRRGPARGLLLRRLPAGRGHGPLLAGDAGHRRVRPGWRTCARHLQRLSDPLRVRAPARGLDSQRLPALRMPAGVPAGRGQPLPVHPSGAARRAAGDAGEARRGPLPCRRRDPEGPQRQRTGAAALRGSGGRGLGGGQPQRLGGRHRRHLQPRTQRVRPDAPSRGRHRARARGRERSQDLLVHGGRVPARERGRERRPDHRQNHRRRRARDPRGGPRPRPHRPGVRRDPPAAGPGAQPDGTGRVLGHVVRALQLQELPETPEAASHRGSPGDPRAGRECRRHGHRRRPRRSVQDREPQPPLLHRTVPGRGHRRGRHSAGRLHHGRPPHRQSQLAPVRQHPAPQDPVPGERGGGRHRRLRQLHRGAHRGRGHHFRRVLRRQHPGERLYARTGGTGPDLHRQGPGAAATR